MLTETHIPASGTTEAAANPQPTGVSHERAMRRLFGVQLMKDSMLAGLEEAVTRPDFFKTRAVAKQFFNSGYEDQHLMLSPRPWGYEVRSGWGSQDILFYSVEEGSESNPWVSEQVCAAIDVMTRPIDHFKPDVVAQAQRVLSAVLIRHPVLMHPAINVAYSYCDGRKSQVPCPRVSVAQAIAMSEQGRFPMPEDGYSEEQLRSFYNHPCTKLALFGGIVAHTASKNPDRMYERMKPRDHLTQCQDRAPRPPFLASMFLAHKLTEIGKGDSALFPASVLAAPGTFFGASEAYATTFLNACGLADAPAYPAAFAVFNALGLHKDAGFWNSVIEQFSASLFIGGLGIDDIAGLSRGVTRIVEGMRLVGLRETNELAATLLYQQLLGPSTTDYPKVQLHEAMAFVGALVDHGVTVGYRHVPFSEPAWREALQIHCKAQTMAATIEDEMAKAKAPELHVEESLVPAEPLSPARPARRVRMGM